ncbi:MAG: hypothetical protein CO070_03675, partial [Gallionellales bacterium CG_4_9_14_0_8_um_filter_55_61]
APGVSPITVDTINAIHLNDYLLIPDASRNCTQLQATPLPATTSAAATATLINLGQTAVAIPALQYRINGTNFNLEHSTDSGTTWSSVADNIVNLQAQYGIANAGSQSISCWTDATGSACNGSDWANPPAADIYRIKAIRVAIVARSSQKTAGITTTANPVAWTQPTTTPTSSAAPVINLSTSVGTDWGHYRYKVYQTVIPVRNVIWGNL